MFYKDKIQQLEKLSVEIKVAIEAITEQQKKTKKKLDISNFEIDDEAEIEWLINMWDNDGFRSYIKVRDLVLLKKIAICTENRDFQSALEVNGRRLELLYLAAEAKKQDQLKK